MSFIVRILRGILSNHSYVHHKTTSELTASSTVYVGIPKACMYGHKLNFMQSAQLCLFLLFLLYIRVIL